MVLLQFMNVDRTISATSHYGLIFEEVNRSDWTTMALEEVLLNAHIHIIYKCVTIDHADS